MRSEGDGHRLFNGYHSWRMPTEGRHMRCTSIVESSGLFELRLKYFRNDNGRDNTGACCSGRSDSVTGKCIGTCKTRFRVCLKHYQAKIDTTSQCTFGDVMTPVLGENTINMTSQSQQIGFVNPIQFPFDFAWPKEFEGHKNLASLSLIALTVANQFELETITRITPIKQFLFVTYFCSKDSNSSH
uniref:Notch ligand N-terminal domain-containing protein n=1 Tax=Phlebotomus papatasi TaxID=29031 RepID=A0A1B0EX48_PHLPP